MQERWWRVFQRATVDGGAWAHAAVLETGGSALSSPSLPSATVTCKIKQKHNIGSRF
jgi:hypothetical protein